MSMPSKLLIFLLGFSITSSLFAASPIEDYSSTKAYTAGSLVLVGQDSYIAIKDAPAGNAPSNTSEYWTNLSVAATALSVPVETVPTLSTDTILNSLPGSTPPDSNATGTPKIVRMSVRGHIGTGDDERFMRLAVSGTANVMLRAIGPSLGDLSSSLANVSLLDPEMIIWEGKSTGNIEVLANNNDNYTTRTEASQIESISSSLSVVIPIKSSESASIADYSTGTYYANVRDKSYSASYGTRIGWVGADITDTSGTAKFTGVSTRGVIKPGDGSMFASFEIIGDSNGTRKLFLRARGASLGTLGVKNVLSNINLKLFKLGGAEPTLITSNNDYTSESNSAEIATKAQSFYGALDATDAGLIVDLAPGYYSIWAESESGATGVGWVGIDDITE
jgi:hypothetical protein